MRPGADLRLVPIAAAAWVAALAAIRFDWQRLGLLGAATLIGAGLLVVPAGRRDRSGRWRGAAALALGVAAAVLLAGSGQQHARGAGLLGTAVDHRWTVELTVVLHADPRPMPGDRCRYPVVVQQVRAHGAAAVAAAPAELDGPCTRASVGSRLRATGRLAPPGRPGRVVAVLRVGEPPQVVAAPSGLAGVAAQVRTAAGRVAGRVPGPAGELLPAIAWGDTSHLSTDLTAAMRSAGLTHVTAVSGAHFALVSALALAVGAALRLPRAGRAGLTVLAGGGVLLLVGPQPSVLRAAVMGAVAVVGLMVGRPASGPAALATAVAGLLVVDPWLAGELGFVLSVAATAGLVLLTPPLVTRWSPVVGRGPALVLAVPLVAQLACSPVLLGLGPTVATWAVPANLAAAPAVGPATVLGLGSAALAPWWPAGASWLAAGAGAACWWIVLVATVAAGAPASAAVWASGAVGVLTMVGAGAGLLGLLLQPAARGRLGRWSDDAAHPHEAEPVDHPG